MKNDDLKRMILYVFASTGAVLFFLAFFYMFRENKFISAAAVLEIILADLVITIGLYMTNKIEFRFAIFEYALDIVFMTVVIVISGILFNWYSHIPVWVSIVIVIVIYVIFNLLDIVRVSNDIKEMNKLLQKLKEKDDKTAS